MKSVLFLEKDHKDKGQGFKNNEGDNFSHAEVYFRQVSNENFLNGTPDFQRGILKVMTDYFKDDYDDGKVEGLIEKTNKAILKTGYKFTFKRTSMQSEAIDIKVMLLYYHFY